MPSSATPTAFPTDSIQPQTQSGTGLDSKLEPKPIYTMLEHFHSENGNPSFHEYTGCGKLKNRKVLITGGDSGIGRAVALMMAREGAKISIVFLEQEMSDAKEVKAQIEKESKEFNNGSGCTLIPLDLMSRDNCFKAVQRHVDEHGRIDVLINNSGRQDLCDNFEKINLDQVENTFRLNIFGMFAITKAALPHMRRGGSIINSTSVAAYKGSPNLVDYASTKGAIVTFTKSLGLQLAPRGIRVNAVAPGIIYTALQAATGGQAPETVDSIGVEAAPLGRPGQPSEVGPAYVFLASHESTYTTGAVIHVTGGTEVYG
ncbi:hypothetical protein PTTG_06401 [Puccinia triticina 1-1 BBBD Race 1]|uniref:Oxidoreductase n=2 Tax=Puccinia triticina TaxID=208348 RepID=A0A0C4EZY7_PUCT1|nr:uncharacterized protein PtA15_18A21 [Puccinia triticina]OAV92463.1 hypothetical protein PTTG_06401 [Puccinia triticina 1-1 BBBD Race 1]WAQ92966.1 hypothetical protein PtA15_18A21 [Puccinia triticina]WAR62946.1 hypothetical protein PtB15_18B28 [Puccinia triticina]